MSHPFDWRRLSQQELERQFNPRATVADFQIYLDRTRLLGQAAREEFVRIADLRYGIGPRQLVDLFVATPEAPCLVYVHGGYWRALSKDQFHALAKAFVPSGISVALVGYDLCPTVSLETCVRQIGDALDWCGRELREHCKGVVHLCGSSAGAHLLSQSLMLRGHGREFVSAWLVSGIYDLEPVLQISVNADIGLSEASARDNSPLLRVRDVQLPLHIRVGSMEAEAWIDQSLRFHDACRKLGCDTSYGLLPNAHHFSTGLAVEGSPLHQDIVACLLGTAASETSC